MFTPVECFLTFKMPLPPKAAHIPVSRLFLWYPKFQVLPKNPFVQPFWLPPLKDAPCVKLRHDGMVYWWIVWPLRRPGFNSESIKRRTWNIDNTVKSPKIHHAPAFTEAGSAKAGIQNYSKTMDSRLRGNDVKGRSKTFYESINIERYTLSHPIPDCPNP